MDAFLSRTLLSVLLALVLANIGMSADQKALYEKVSAVSFEVHKDRRMSGSGWFAPEKGWAFTAFHVVGSRDCKVELKQGKKSWKAQVHAVSPLYDVALLKVEGDTPEGLEFAESFPAVGSELYLYGAPLFRHGVWLPGRVARTDLTYEWLPDLSGAICCYHVAAHGPKGVSGGPWVNDEGKLAGLQSGTMTLSSGQQGIVFVTPAAAIKSLLEKKEHVPMISFGCAFEELSEQPAAYLAKLAENQSGVVVKVLKDSSPLAEAGVKEGDILVSIDGDILASRNGAYAAVQALGSDKAAKLVVLRPGGEPRALEVKAVSLH